MGNSANQRVWFCLRRFVEGWGGGITWGSPSYGGDCRKVKERLRGVRQIQSTDRAFAAILQDGSVVTWGNPRYGGDSRQVSAGLRESPYNKGIFRMYSFKQPFFSGVLLSGTTSGAMRRTTTSTHRSPMARSSRPARQHTARFTIRKPAP